MSEPQLLTADQVEPDLLADFLRRVYVPLKSDFLNRHGAWWHQGQANRLVLLLDSRPVGYCGVIPARAWIAGRERSALWWVDLVIAPECRGRGLQSLLDERVRQMSDLLLGFPNEVAIKIHRRHGWGVSEDMQILLLPLRPMDVKLVRNTEGWRGASMRGAALALGPVAAGWRVSLGARQPSGVTRLDELDAELLAGIFLRTKQDGLNTTWRDASYFAWRYGAAPNPGEYACYVAGPPAAPSHYLIARHITQPDGVRYSRILDVFGDFRDTDVLRELMGRAVQDCIAHGSGQVTLLATRPELKRVGQRLGFLLSAPFGFCWLSDSQEIMGSLAGENYWTLADSDNDAPD